MKNEIAAIDSHLEKDFNQVELAESKFSGIELTRLVGLLAKICMAYAAVRPVLKFVRKYLLIWKPSWQKAIDGIMTAVDEACGQTTP